MPTFLLEFTVDGADWEPAGESDGYLQLYRRAREEAKSRGCYARISNTDKGVLLINITPDGLGCGVEHGTVT